MKRALSILAAMTVLAMTCVLSSSCQKEEAKKASLAGTSWEANALIAQITYSFIDDSKVSYIITMDGQAALTVEGTYTYNEPNVTVTLTYQGESHTSTGTVDGNKLVMNEDGQKVTYTKK